MISPTGFASRLFWSGALAFTIMGTLPGLYGLALPGYAAAFGLGQGGGGLLLSVHGVGACVSVLAGLLGAAFLSVRLGLVAIALGAGLLAAQIVWPLMLLGAFLCGIGFGTLSVVVNRQFLMGFGDRGPGMVAIVNGIFGIGAIAGPILFVQAGGAPALVFAATALCAVLALPVAAPETGPMQAAAGIPDLRRWPVLIVLFNFFCGLIEVGLFGLGPTALLAGGLDGLGVARLAAGFSVSYLLGRLALYWLTRFWPSDGLFVLALAGTALSLGLAAVVSPSVGFVATGAFTAMFFPTFYVWAITVLGDPRMGSAVLCSGLAAAAISPLLLGMLLGWFGVTALFGLLAGVAVLVLCAYVPAMIWARAAAPRQA